MNESKCYVSKYTIDELIKEIAAKHYIKLEKDEPILILYTMNEFMIREFYDVLGKLHKELENKFASMSFRLESDVTSRIDRQVYTVIAAYRQVLNESLSQCSKNVAENLSDCLQPILDEWIKTIGHGKQYACYNIAASCITFLSACIICIIFFFH